MTKEEAFKLISNYFNEQFEIEHDNIKPDANLFEDLKLDSIDALDMAGMLESELDIEVEEEELMAIRTVQDVVDFLLKKATAVPAAQPAQS
jgi:acyl carrier protein